MIGDTCSPRARGEIFPDQFIELPGKRRPTRTGNLHRVSRVRARRVRAAYMYVCVRVCMYARVHVRTYVCVVMESRVRTRYTAALS